MKPLIIICGVVILTTLCAHSATACMCNELKGVTVVNTGPQPTPDEIRKWRAEQTDFALFTGRVIRIETVHVRRSLKKVTVAVESYWLGVKEAQVTIYTGVGHGDCGVPYSKGKEYFFWAARVPVSHLLETDICGPTTIDPKLFADLDEIFGRAKSFT